MSSETSSPGEQTSLEDEIRDLEDERAIQAATDRFNEMSLNPSLYGDFAGSTQLSNQMNKNALGNQYSKSDAFIPGMNVLTYISQQSAKNMQQQLQRGGTPVYGDGRLQGVMGAGLLGGRGYSGNPDFDPNRSRTDDGGDTTTSVAARRNNRPVRGVSNDARVLPRRVSPRTTIRGTGAPTLAPRLRSRGGASIRTSSAGVLGSAPVQRKTLLGS